MPGRCPTPTALAALRGFPGRRPRHADEPSPPTLSPARLPDPPPALSEAARPHWFQYAGQLSRLGVLTDADLVALALLSESTATYWEAMAEVRRLGLVVTRDTKAGPQIAPNPYLPAASAAMRQVRRLLYEFGLTPAARGSPGA